MFLTQNLFPRGAKSRTIALNTYYLVLMKNARDASQVTTLDRKMFPGEARVLTEAYLDVDRYRLRTHIFPGEDPMVYQSL